jgi:hypothetical protein
VPSPSGYLSGVAATSARNAWAVGAAGTGKTLILHWNGKEWKRVPSPTPGVGGQLYGVAATSARSAWAVGDTAVNHLGTVKSLILGWNSNVWKQVPSHYPGGGPLFGVAAGSARSAWAVGCGGCAGGPNKVLIERWNGAAWKRVPSPAPAGSYLAGVAGGSARSAWAVGYTYPIGASERTLAERWNGTTWRRVPSPSPAERTSRGGRDLGPQRLGGRLHRQRQDLDPAVERREVEVS